MLHNQVIHGQFPNLFSGQSGKKQQRTPPSPGSLQIRPPETREPDPLRDQRRRRIERQSRPCIEHGRGTERESRITLVATQARELHPPVEGAEEGDHDGAVSDLDVEGTVEDREGDARVEVGYGALRGEC